MTDDRSLRTRLRGFRFGLREAIVVALGGCTVAILVAWYQLHSG